MRIREGKRAKTRRILEEIAEAFRLDFPDIYCEQLEAVRRIKGHLKFRSGRNESGTMALSFVLVPEVELFIKHKLGHDFFKSQENKEMLRKVWSQLNIKTRC